MNPLLRAETAEGVLRVTAGGTWSIRSSQDFLSAVPDVHHVFPDVTAIEQTVRAAVDACAIRSLVLCLE